MNQAKEDAPCLTLAHLARSRGCRAVEGFVKA
jgi:hypothetical protein